MQSRAGALCFLQALLLASLPRPRDTNPSASTSQAAKALPPAPRLRLRDAEAEAAVDLAASGPCAKGTGTAEAASRAACRR